MSGNEDLREELAQLRGRAAHAEADHFGLEAGIVRAQRELEERRRLKKDAGDLVKTLEKLTTHDARQVRARLTDARQLIEQARRRLIDTRAPTDLYDLLDPDTPLVLLPVRLETRFQVQDDSSPELLIRIYPDDIHVDTHEPGLTDEEVSWGKHFWKEMRSAADNREQEAQAWQQLVERFGPRRSAWIARETEPEEDSPEGPGPERSAPRPRFPDPARRAGSWTRPPRTSVLPDRWAALGYNEGTRVFTEWGATIPDTLAVGPDPEGSGDDDADELPVDSDMLWMVDFARAEQVGMALRVRLPSSARDGLERLVVLGIKGTLDADASREELESLLEAHSYTRGFAFVPQGTPTNSTGDVKAGYSARDGERSPFSSDAQRGDQAGSDGYLTARALGLCPRVFASVSNACNREQQDARNMNAALWPATLGYFLQQMMADIFPEESILRIRRHFIDHVRGRGPFPAWRIGDVPYGILPVQALRCEQDPSLTHVDPGQPGDELLPLLSAVRQVWERAVQRVPRVGTASDPDQALMEILSTDGVSSSYAARSLLGRDYLQYLFAFTGWLRPAVEAWWDECRKQAAAGLRALGIPWEPRLVWCVYDRSRALELSDELVQALPPSEISPVQPNYIRLLRQATYEEIRTENLGESITDSLLYLLLRHSALLAYVDTARAVLRAGDMQTRWHALAMIPRDLGWREPELVDISEEAETMTPSRLLEYRSDSLEGPSMAEYLDGLGEPGGPLLAQLVEFRQSLAYLEQRPSAVLERLLVETLDLCSHRLDAWITSFAVANLDHLRQKVNPTGVHLAGYGWVENIEPSARARSAGFVHAPSIAHGVTAALLHSGHLSGGMGGTDTGAFDLTSERVRRARWLLDGVRRGESLGALLGYRFERGLHERSTGDPDLALQRFVPAFRELAPLAAEGPKETDEPVIAIAAGKVVDGLKLVHHWREKWRENGLPLDELQVQDGPPTGKERAALRDVLARVAEAVDAVGDAITAESIYQTAQGNPVRTAATLDAIARSEAPPPELEVARTPRTGSTLTHRVLVLLDRGHSDSTDLPGWAETPRARAEPHLNAWAGRILGDPGRVRCRAQYLDPDEDEPHEGVEMWDVDLAQLAAPGSRGGGLSPLDILLMQEAADGSPGLSEIQQRLVHHVLGSYPERAENAGVRIIFERDPDWNQHILSFPEFFHLAGTARSVIVGSRGLDPADLLLPEDPEPETGEYTLEDLKRRAGRAVGDLGEIHSELREAIDSVLELISREETVSLEEPLERLRCALFSSTWFAVEAAVPATVVGHDEKHARELLTQAQAVSRELAARENVMDSLDNGSDVDDVRRAGDHCMDLLRTAFGSEFPALPAISPPDLQRLNRMFDDSETLQGGNPLESVQWFQQTARVREPLRRLYDLFMFAEALNGEPHLEFEVGQIPPGKPTWVGLAHGDHEPMTTSGVSLVLHRAGGARVSDGHLAGASGLLIDEWVEVIPSEAETTAVTFHFDEPAARPPQAILLAVPPSGQKTWSLEALERTVLETLDLARIRGVDPDSLAELGHFLPALYFARNAAGDTVSSDFTRLARDLEEEG